MRGRKPTPTELKLRGGNPGRRPVNEHEPKHAALDPTCPDELTDPVARAEWNRIAGDLGAHGHVTTADRATLVAYCLLWAQWRALEAEAAHGPFVARTATGYPVPSVALGMANRVFGLFLRAAAELGLTPSSRSRVSAASVPAEADEFAAAQRARPRLVK